MKRLLLTCVLISITLICASATSIDIKTENTAQNGGIRTSTVVPIVTAHYDDGVVTTTIENYDGQVYWYICNSDGIKIAERYYYSNGNSVQAYQLLGVHTGLYSVHYVLDGYYSYGIFFLE